MAASNVINLPTAATRKVRQPRAGDRRALAEHLDQHPAEFLFPFHRDLIRKREQAQGSAAESMAHSTELLIACAMLMVASRDLRAKVYGAVFGIHDVFRTPETQKAVLLVERMLGDEPEPKGAA